jgi:hypothetical protein
MTVLTLQCRYCNKDFDPTQQKINLHGYCKPCCIDNHATALKAQLKEIEKIQVEIYGERYAYYKSMDWV